MCSSDLKYFAPQEKTPGRFLNGQGRDNQLRQWTGPITRVQIVAKLPHRSGL